MGGKVQQDICLLLVTCLLYNIWRSVWFKQQQHNVDTRTQAQPLFPPQYTKVLVATSS